MTNEEKAKEIATRWEAKGLPYNAIYDTAIEVMEWNDARQMVFLQRLVLKNPNPAMLELLQRKIQQLKRQLTHNTL